MRHFAPIPAPAAPLRNLTKSLPRHGKRTLTEFQVWAKRTSLLFDYFHDPVSSTKMERTWILIVPGFCSFFY